MSIIATMNHQERQSWVTLLADGLVFVWFWKAMAPGWSFVPDALTRAELGQTYLGLVLVTIFYHAVIGAAFALTEKREAFESDERDALINAAGTKFGYSVMQVGAGVILVAAVIGYAFETDVVPFLSIQTFVQLLFAITFVSYLADLVKHATIVAQYRDL